MIIRANTSIKTITIDHESSFDILIRHDLLQTDMIESLNTKKNVCSDKNKPFLNI